MDKREIDNIYELNDERSRNRIIIESFTEIEFSKNTIVQNIICILISINVSIYVVYALDTVLVANSIMQLFLTINLAFLAMILGSYAVFQALMRDEIINVLIKDEKNILKSSNRTFVNLSIIYIITIFIDALTIIVTQIIDNAFFIISLEISNALCALYFSVIFSIEFILLLENINFVINLYKMFNVYNIYRVLEKNNKEK